MHRARRGLVDGYGHGLLRILSGEPTRPGPWLLPVPRHAAARPDTGVERDAQRTPARRAAPHSGRPRDLGDAAGGRVGRGHGTLCTHRWAAHAKPHGANPNVQTGFTRPVRQVPRPTSRHSSRAGEGKQEQTWTQLTLIGAPWCWSTTRRSSCRPSTLRRTSSAVLCCSPTRRVFLAFSWWVLSRIRKDSVPTSRTCGSGVTPPSRRRIAMRARTDSSKS